MTDQDKTTLYLASSDVRMGFDAAADTPPSPRLAHGTGFIAVLIHRADSCARAASPLRPQRPRSSVPYARQAAEGHSVAGLRVWSGLPMLGPDEAYVFTMNAALTLREAAEKLRVSESHLRALINDGAILAIDVGRGGTRRDLRVPEEALDDFAEKRRVTPRLSVPVGRKSLRAKQLTTPSEGGYLAHRAARLAKTKET